METELEKLVRLTREALVLADRIGHGDAAVCLSAALDALGSEDHMPPPDRSDDDNSPDY